MKHNKTIQTVSLIALVAFFLAAFFQIGRFTISDTKAEFARYYGVYTQEERIKRIPGLGPIVEILERFPELHREGARTLLIRPRPGDQRASIFVLSYYLLPGQLFLYERQAINEYRRQKPVLLEDVSKEWLEGKGINWILYNYGRPEVTVEPYP